MRIQKDFGKRKVALLSDEPKKIYFLAFEGTETEPNYFEGISSCRDYLGLNVNIEICQLLRNSRESGKSNPRVIIELIKDFSEQLKAGEYKVSTVALWVEDYCKKYDIKSEINSEILTWFETQMELKSDDIITDVDEACLKISEYLEAMMIEGIESLSEYVNSLCATYTPGYDCICVIVDRDKQSFKTNQYDEVLEICKNEGFKFYVTNPCFEFWLLMHFDEVNDIDRTKIKDNNRVTKRKKFTENELHRLVPGYSKNNIKFEEFRDRIDSAIANEKNFEEDPTMLKENIGSNIGMLISELKS